MRLCTLPWKTTVYMWENKNEKRTKYLISEMQDEAIKMISIVAQNSKTFFINIKAIYNSFKKKNAPNPIMQRQPLLICWSIAFKFIPCSYFH